MSFITKTLERVAPSKVKGQQVKTHGLSRSNKKKRRWVTQCRETRKKAKVTDVIAHRQHGIDRITAHQDHWWQWPADGGPRRQLHYAQMQHTVPTPSLLALVLLLKSLRSKEVAELL